jgi:hypothetical protein
MSITFQSSVKSEIFVERHTPKFPAQFGAAYWVGRGYRRAGSRGRSLHQISLLTELGFILVG